MAKNNPTMAEKFSELLPIGAQQRLERTKSRQVSAASNVSGASDTSEFLEARVNYLSTEKDILSVYRQALHDLPSTQLDEASMRQELKDLATRASPLDKELRVVKRQRKILEEDLAEELPYYDDVATAYAKILNEKTMAASAKPEKWKKFDRKQFRRDILEFYGAERNNGSEVYCHVLGWRISEQVKAAHLVPRSLQGEELSYLFGVGEMVVSDKRNGISLSSRVELLLDKGAIVIVPFPPTDEAQPTRWRVVVVDETVLEQTIEIGVKVKDIDGKELRFLTNNRPARRYLYFRYIMTYLYQKKLGNLRWAEKIEARGKMWATPGPYLRKSFLTMLARQVSDTYLPEAFWKTTTFGDAPACPARSPEEEATLALSLSVQMEKERKEAERSSFGYDSDEDSDEDSDD